MDFFAAHRKLTTEFPDINQAALSAALAAEIQAVESDLKGTGRRNQYAEAVETAYKRVRDWVKDADEYAVSLNWSDIGDFVSSHRYGCVIAVLLGKGRTKPPAPLPTPVKDSPYKLCSNPACGAESNPDQTECRYCGGALESPVL